MANLTPELRDRILYEDDRIAIFNADSQDEHEIAVDGRNAAGDFGAYCYLSRGILKDMAERKDIKSFEASLNAMNSNFVYQLKQINIPLETIAWAFSKARIKELEQEAHYVITNRRKFRTMPSKY